jgi:hypothetical protein
MENVFNLKESLDKLGADITKALINELKSGGKNASGELAKSISFKYVKSGENNDSIQIIAEDYADDVNSGRKLGTFPKVAPIKKWMEIKGIASKALFPIMKKIKEKGIKPFPFIDKVLQSKNDELVSILEKASKEEIELYLTDLG